MSEFIARLIHLVLIAALGAPAFAGYLPGCCAEATMSPGRHANGTGVAPAMACHTDAATGPEGGALSDPGVLPPDTCQHHRCDRACHLIPLFVALPAEGFLAALADGQTVSIGPSHPHLDLHLRPDIRPPIGA